MADNGEIAKPSQDPEIKPQPANPSRRKWGIAAVAALATAFGLKKASETPTGQAVISKASEEAQKIISTAPIQDHSDRRPSLYTQQKEVEKNLDAQDHSKRATPQIEPTQQKIEADIKATLDADPANRWVKPTPTPKK